MGTGQDEAAALVPDINVTLHDVEKQKRSELS